MSVVLEMKYRKGASVEYVESEARVLEGHSTVEHYRERTRGSQWMSTVRKVPKLIWKEEWRREKASGKRFIAVSIE